MFRTRLIVVLPVVALLCAGTGCSIVKKFDIYCVVRNAADGSPLSSVESKLNIHSFTGGRTGADGRMVNKLEVNVIALNPDQPGWKLRLEKPGFEPEEIDIKPGPEANNDKSPVPIHVIVSLRPISPPQVP